MRNISIDVATAPLNLYRDERTLNYEILSIAQSRSDAESYQALRRLLRKLLVEFINSSSLEHEEFGYSYVCDDEDVLPRDLYYPFQDLLDPVAEGLSQEDRDLLLSAAEAFQVAFPTPPLGAAIFDSVIEFQAFTGEWYEGQFDFKMDIHCGSSKYVYLDLEDYVESRFTAKQQLVWLMGSHIGLEPQCVWCINVNKMSSLQGFEKVSCEILRETGLICRKIRMASQIEDIGQTA
jgi:hypothetical protein